MIENKKMPQIQEEQPRQYIARRSMSLALVLCLVLCMAVAVSAAETGSVVTADDWKPVTDAITNQITVSAVVGVLAVIVGLSIGFVFMWWGVRKASRALMKAFQKGKISI